MYRIEGKSKTEGIASNNLLTHLIRASMMSLKQTESMSGVQNIILEIYIEFVYDQEKKTKRNTAHMYCIFNLILRVIKKEIQHK